MAILTGINTRLHKSAGDWTFMRNNNKTIAIQKVEKKAVPVRSRRQMLRRMPWANVVAMWSSFSGHLRPSFEKKGRGLNDFAAFMKANLGSNNVYLKRNEVSHGVCVVAPYTLTDGTLPAITVVATSGGKMKSDIALGDLVIGAETKVSDFAKAVLENNADYREGDQIACFLAQQVTVGEANTPKVRMAASRVVLDSDDDSLLLETVDEAGFASLDGHLASKGSVNGGIAWVHSRMEKGKTKVSPQSLAVNNNLLALYTGTTALNAAIESYGGLNKEDYLTPDSGDEEEQEQVNP